MHSKNIIYLEVQDYLQKHSYDMLENRQKFKISNII